MQVLSAQIWKTEGVIDGCRAIWVWSRVDEICSDPGVFLLVVYGGHRRRDGFHAFPRYIAEISPAHLRGRMVAINQLTVVTGLLLTISSIITCRNVGEDAWRWRFGMGLVPSALFFVGPVFYGCRKSPLAGDRRSIGPGCDNVWRTLWRGSFRPSSVADISESMGATKQDGAIFLPRLANSRAAAVMVGSGMAVFQRSVVSLSYSITRQGYSAHRRSSGWTAVADGVLSERQHVFTLTGDAVVGQKGSGSP